MNTSQSFTRWPIVFSGTSRAVSTARQSGCAAARRGRDRLRAPQDPPRAQDGILEHPIPGAAADVGADGLRDLVAAGFGTLVQQGLRGHHEPGDAEAALHGALLLVGGHYRRPLALGEPLRRRDMPAIERGDVPGAGLDGLPVHDHEARTATAVIAAVLHVAQGEVLAQVTHQGHRPGDVVGLPVHRDAHGASFRLVAIVQTTDVSGVPQGRKTPCGSSSARWPSTTARWPRRKTSRTRPVTSVPSYGVWSTFSCRSATRTVHVGRGSSTRMSASAPGRRAPLRGYSPK